MSHRIEPAVAAQITAASPERSSWVAANAGSGKTRVLTNRVARLLLTGTEPQKILCLTYTKAAAAEMQTRLFQTLGRWAMLDDDVLRAELEGLGAGDTGLDPASLSRARTLFARALETPGGLKIQTIHAFCEALLRRFPLEAGVAPQFTVLEDRQAKALRSEILDAIAERDPAALVDLANFLSGDDPDSLLQEIARNRSAFQGPFDPLQLAHVLGADPDETLESIAGRAVGPEDLSMLGSLVPILAASGPNDRKAAASISSALLLDPIERLEALEAVLLTGKGAKEPFSARAGKFPTKAIRLAHVELSEHLDDLMMRVEAARPRRLGRQAFDRSAALNRFARLWLADLDARKAGPGLLDFDDMIDKTRILLSDPANAAWVLWRLDGGLDHVLVDEAQDTSPNQWQVVSAITDEFFAGLGAREIDRTVFVVGDEKQSIYSFQGADPRAFGGMRQHYETLLEGLEAQLQRCALIHSFRSARPVLSLVDAVFRGPAGEAFEDTVDHAPFDPARPGRVEIWPFLEKSEKAEEPPWHAPVDALSPDDPVELLADRIAGTIGRWLQTGKVMPSSNPVPIRAGDVMILVQRRNALFHAIIRALKRADVPVAGADVLRIGAELAVKDLLACLRVAATPSDDLSLAAILRSPLGGISEEQLFDLAHGRPSLLWRELRAAEFPAFHSSRALISDLLDEADFLRPFELLQRILIRHDGRRKLVARLGMEAEDGIDALLDQALEYERTEAPTLTGFLAWIDRDELKIKRRSDEGANQVRVMTVHGSKGLEAPIVILPDTVDRHEGRNAPEILADENDLAFWRMAAERSPDHLVELENHRRARARAENMRLLYVALTRAESWLIICGAGSAPKEDGMSWYTLARRAMETLEHEQLPGDSEAEEATLVLSHNWFDEVSTPKEERPEAKHSLPDWAGRPAPDRDLMGGPAVLLPSQLGGAHALPAESGVIKERDSLARGTALHLLLERGQQEPRSDWPKLVRDVLPIGTSAQAEVLEEAARILDAPELAFLFGPGSLAEAEISAPLDPSGTLRLQGRIDRLVIESDRILAVDFKSNAITPTHPLQVPEGILRQLGAYRAALNDVWRDRRIETAILWTRTAELMVIPADLSDEAFTRARVACGEG
ncbi:double-strand break repair helicase AddA [Amaricoccus macauensis]|uniref:double-strand break repair helicase AddA n=1 Tax=Amaricoccus macauensis TaxID=57001 RepID=UPI003C7E8F40